MGKFKENEVIIILIAVAITVSGLFIWRVLGISKEPPAPPVSQNITWNTYSNTVHEYKISYPPEVMIAPIAEMDSRQIDKIDDLEVFVPGKITALFVTVLTPYTNASGAVAMERMKLINLPLRQFAETLRQYQITDRNPAIHGKQVGNLEEDSIGGRRAYSFTLTKSFNLGLTGGYALADATVYNYFFTENRNGEKFIIHYPMDDSLSEQMRNSFVFTEK